MRKNLKYNHIEKSYTDLETGEEIKCNYLSKDAGILNRLVVLKLDTVLHFGSYKNKTISDVLTTDLYSGLSYLVWLDKNKFNLSEELRIVLKQKQKQDEIEKETQYERIYVKELIDSLPDPNDVRGDYYIINLFNEKIKINNYPNFLESKQIKFIKEKIIINHIDFRYAWTKDGIIFKLSKESN